MTMILAVAIKALRQARRDPLTLVMLLGVPTFMLLLYGYALNYDVRHVRLAVQDRCRSAESQANSPRAMRSSATPRGSRRIRRWSGPASSATRRSPPCDQILTGGMSGRPVG